MSSIHVISFHFALCMSFSHVPLIHVSDFMHSSISCIHSLMSSRFMSPQQISFISCHVVKFHYVRSLHLLPFIHSIHSVHAHASHAFLSFMLLHSFMLFLVMIIGPRYSSIMQKRNSIACAAKTISTKKMCTPSSS